MRSSRQMAPLNVRKAALWSRDALSVRIEIPAYVDDITISAPTDAEAGKVVAELAEHLELRDFVGMSRFTTVTGLWGRVHVLH